MRAEVEDYLQYLAVECGLARATIAAYRRDLERFITATCRARRAGSDPRRGRRRWRPITSGRFYGWRSGADSRPRAGRARWRRCAACFASWRRRAGSPRTASPRSRRRGWSAACRRCCRSSRSRACSRHRGPPGRWGLRDRAVLELLYATGARVSEVSGLDLGRVRPDLGYVRVCGKGSKERLVPLGRAAAHALEEYLLQGRPRLLGRARPDEPALLLSRRGRRLSRGADLAPAQAAGAGHRPAGVHLAAYPAAQLRHPPAGGRRRGAGGAGDARPRQRRHHPDLHPRRPQPAAGGPPQLPTRGHSAAAGGKDRSTRAGLRPIVVLGVRRRTTGCACSRFPTRREGWARPPPRSGSPRRLPSAACGCWRSIWTRRPT
ncbi:MAG: hypothetical protein KatS3mg102_0047 [Planctomycetota bacterium]|nr:MAG: hypothetical protein KatS3mg102_0047 [Planctomycetota bacterium]